MQLLQDVKAGPHVGSLTYCCLPSYLRCRCCFTGQGYFGTVSGEITDPSRAVVPGAQVTLVDQQKGYQFTNKSDKSGRYLFTSIPPGTYSVSAENAGVREVRAHQCHG